MLTENAMMKKSVYIFRESKKWNVFHEYKIDNRPIKKISILDIFGGRNLSPQ